MLGAAAGRVGTGSKNTSVATDSLEGCALCLVWKAPGTSQGLL